MGCANSKVDELPAVCLCRERCGFLDEAIRQRFALAEAHVAYLHSLKAVGLSLDRFFSRDLLAEDDDGSLSPRRRNSDETHHLHSPSHSDDDLEEEPAGNGGSKAMHHLHYNSNFPGGGDGHMNVNYMKKNQATPSVIYTQRPMTDPETTMYMGESSSFPYYTDNNGYQGPSPQDGNVSAASKSPPPPPPPPTSSNWDFLNPFESFERYYPSYPRSRDSREEEGIPDLEDENEVVKEVIGDQKLVNIPKPPPEETDPLVHLVDKKVVDEPKDRASAPEVKPRAGSKLKGDINVVRQIHLEFERAAESGTELAKFLEVDKLPPNKRKHSVNHVSPKLLRFPVLSSATKGSDGADDPTLDVDQEMDLRSKKLSSTLHKLHLWEKKLHEEVKVEEKMRTLHERKSQKLKLFDEKGAEAHKVDKTRALVRSLSTKIKIAIQVIDKISVKINSLRDDELWPQLREFIQRSTGMWKSMLECNRNQCQAIAEAKRLDTITLGNKFSEAHFEATKQLEHDVVDWTLRFSDWVGSQKGYVRSMHGWLMKCLLYVPEETQDGIVPFSPGRLGAPSIFVVCNHWRQSLDRISEKEVVDSMRDFAFNVLQLWDRDRWEIRQRMLENKEETKIKSLDREEQEMQKHVQALTNGRVVYRGETNMGLQASLQRALEAMERFAVSSLEVYEDLLHRIEDEEHVG